MFRWALSQDMVELDPTAGLTAYESGRTRDRVLTFEEVGTLWAWLATDEIPAKVSTIIRLQLLIGARCGEIAGIAAEEIDRENWLWTLPAARSKNKRPRVTPIVGEARELLSPFLSLAEKGPLFPAETGSTMSSVHVGQSLWYRRARLPIPKFTSHDLRRTVASGLVEMGVPLELVAKTIGHDAGGREVRTLVRHYVRTDMIEHKTRVLTAWDSRLSEAVSNPSSSSSTRQKAQRLTLESRVLLR
jgi:integrase